MSFSLYMTHLIFINVYYPYASQFPMPFAMFVSLLLLFSAAVYWFIEKPSRAFIVGASMPKLKPA